MVISYSKLPLERTSAVPTSLKVPTSLHQVQKFAALNCIFSRIKHAVLQKSCLDSNQTKIEKISYSSSLYNQQKAQNSFFENIVNFFLGKRSDNFELSFGIFNFFQKTNKNTSHSSKKEFIRSFFGRIFTA